MISCKHPTKDTVNNFWKMVCLNNVTCIINLSQNPTIITNGEDQMTEYVPNLFARYNSRKLIFGDLKIVNDERKEIKTDGEHIRTLNIYNINQPSKVVQ